jgi:hypothetical protein
MARPFLARKGPKEHTNKTPPQGISLRGCFIRGSRVFLAGKGQSLPFTKFPGRQAENLQKTEKFSTTLWKTNREGWRKKGKARFVENRTDCGKRTGGHTMFVKIPVYGVNG